MVSRIISDKVDSLPKFEDLEILPSIEEKLKYHLRSLSGVFFTSGPTGSGKSVLQMILLSYIASEKINIQTLEDPIEYINPLIVQTQICKDKKFGYQE